MFKNKIFLISFILISFYSITSGQYQRRNGFWITPSRANEINGIAFGAFVSAETFHADSIKIRGLNIEMNPLGILFLPYVIPGSLFSPFYKGDEAAEIANKNVFPDSSRAEIEITGLNISTVSSLGEMNMNGASFCAVATIGQKGNGISVSGIMNKYFQFNGVLIADLQNKVTQSKGLQIALFNYCKDCKGIQIGLINKMGKRILPFFNIRL